MKAVIHVSGLSHFMHSMQDRVIQRIFLTKMMAYIAGMEVSRTGLGLEAGLET